MTFEAESGKKCRYGIAVQSAWGTGIAAAAAFIELACKPFHIDPDVKIREIDGAHGTKNPLQADVITDTKGSMPKVTIEAALKRNEATHFFASHFNNVSEAATSPYSKTFTYPTSDADFTADEGYPLTIVERDPTAARSSQLVDGVCGNLVLECEEGGLLKVSAEFVGRGAPAETFDPSGTWTITAAEFFYWHSIARATIDFGAGAQAINMRKFEFKFPITLVPKGIDSGNFATFIVQDRAPELMLDFTKDAQAASAKANLRSNTAATVNIGWGNATPGTDEGDLDITATIKFTKVPNEKEDILHCPCEGRILAADASTAPLTIILADGEDIGY